MFDLSLEIPILNYVSLNSCQHSAPLVFKTQIKSSMDWCSYVDNSSGSDEKISVIALLNITIVNMA